VRVFTLDKLRKFGGCGWIADRGWPGRLFGGRIRTSTVVLIVAFAVVWWIYDDHQHSARSAPTPTDVPALQVVPPGFVPDPNYTWVPRSRLEQPPATVTVTRTATPTPTPATTPPEPPIPPELSTPATTTESTPPPFGLPLFVLPPPFGPPTTTATPPLPGQTPEPPAAPPPAG
jgi:hypothetical protein